VVLAATGPKQAGELPDEIPGLSRRRGPVCEQHRDRQAVVMGHQQMLGGHYGDPRLGRFQHVPGRAAHAAAGSGVTTLALTTLALAYGPLHWPPVAAAATAH
jgi:hypothetical protein